MNHLLTARALLVLTTLLAACGANYDPPSLIVPGKVRVLGVRAEPAAITLTTETTMTVLAAGAPEDATICYAWAYCPYTWTQNGTFGCVDDTLLVPLGVASTAQVGIADVFSSLAHVQDVFAKLGLQLPSTGSDTTSDACKPATSGGNPLARASLPDSYILFQVAQADLFGGTCPDVKTALATACADRDKCLQGFKRLGIFAATPTACPAFDATTDKNCGVADPCDTHPVCGCDGRTYDTECDRVTAKVSKRSDGACPDQNPPLTGVFVYWPLNDGTLQALGTLQSDTRTYATDPQYAGLVSWPEDVTIVVHPGDSFELLPIWPAEAKEYVGKSADPTAPPVYETLLFSWFTSGGSWAKDRSYDEYPENVFTAPNLNPDGKPVPLKLWIVVRDGRNGTSWLERHVLVTQAAGDPLDQRHPLCRTTPPLPGCPTK